MSNRNDVPIDWTDRERESILTDEAQKALYHALYDFLRQVPKPCHYPQEDWYTECLHEGWCAAEAATHTYDPTRGSLYTYIRQAVHNRLISYLNWESGWSKRHVSINSLGENRDSGGSKWIDSLAGEFLSLMEEMSDRLDVQEALSHLSEEECWLIRQVWIAKRPQAEVARQLEISQPAISKRLKSIAQKLHRLLGWE